MAMIFDPQVYPYMKAALGCIEEELECQGVGACRYDALITAQDQLDGCDCCGKEHARLGRDGRVWARAVSINTARSEEHTSELQSRGHLVCRLLLEKKKRNGRNGHNQDGEKISFAVNQPEEVTSSMRTLNETYQQKENKSMQKENMQRQPSNTYKTK